MYKIIFLFLFFCLILTVKGWGQISTIDVFHHLINKGLIDAQQIDHQIGFSLNMVENQNFISDTALYDFVYFHATQPPIKGQRRVAVYHEKIFILPYDFNVLLDEAQMTLSGASSIIKMFFSAMLESNDLIERIYPESVDYLGREFTHHAIIREKREGVVMKKKWSFWMQNYQFRLARVEVLEVLFSEGRPMHSASSIATPGVGNVSYFDFSRASTNF